MPTSATTPLPTIFTPVNTTIYTKAAVEAGGAAAWLTTSSPLTIFTVTGTVICRVFGVVGATPITSTIDLGTLSVGTTGSVQLFLPTSAVNAVATQFGAGTVWIDATPTLSGELLVAGNLVWAIVNGTPITVTIATQSMAGGAISMICQWLPLSVGATVV